MNYLQNRFGEISQTNKLMQTFRYFLQNFKKTRRDPHTGNCFKNSTALQIELFTMQVVFKGQ